MEKIDCLRIEVAENGFSCNYDSYNPEEKPNSDSPYDRMSPRTSHTVVYETLQGVLDGVKEILEKYTDVGKEKEVDY